MITYPVSQDSRWARYDVALGEVVEKNKTWPRPDGGEIEGDDGTSVMLLHVQGEIPVYDPETQKIESSVEVDVPANEYRTVYSVSSLSQSEINTLQRSEQRQSARDLWFTLDPHYRGPYQPAFDAANSLLDEGGNAEALELLDAIEPTSKIALDPLLLAEFTAIKANFIAMISSMPEV